MAKKKDNPIPSKDLEAAAISLMFQPAFNEWCKEKDAEVIKVLNDLKVVAESERLKLVDAQARHMKIIEEFLKIQTDIFVRLEKKLKK